MNKKGVLGLDTVRVVFILFLVIAVIGVASVLTMVNLRDVTETIDTTTTTLTNSTTDTAVNFSGSFAGGASQLRLCTLTITTIQTQTANSTTPNINTANYTTSACRITAVDGVDAIFNNSRWNITGSYRFSGATPFEITRNLSSATSEFFSNTGTIYSILIVIIIILAIAIVVAVVTRFGGGAARGISAGGGRGEFGSDTVMGV